jgi:plastocyanin
MFRQSRRVALAFACALAAVLLPPVLPVAASDSATTWHVQAGNVDTMTLTSVEAMAFYNARTFVHPGDDVLFTAVGGHTITFNPIRVPGVPNFAYADPNFPAGPTGDTLRFANRTGGALLTSGAIGGGPPGVGGPPVRRRPSRCTSAMMPRVRAATRMSTARHTSTSACSTEA